MDHSEVIESEILVSGIREIPFRYMARQNNILENVFIERMLRFECPYRFFLQNNCDSHFIAIGNILSAFQTERIWHRTNENEKKKKKFRQGKTEDPPSTATQTYSDVLVTYSRKDIITLPLNFKVKLKPEIYWRNTPVMTEQQIRDIWSNKIITGLSEEFKAYNEIEECDLDLELPHSVFGIHHRSLVDIFLEDFSRDENEIYNEILVPGLKALLEKSSVVAGQRGHKYYPTFCGPTLNDFPILPVPLMPPNSPTPSVSSVNASLNSNSCPDIPKLRFPTRSISMQTLYQKAKIQSQSKRQFNKRFQRITRKK